MRLIDADAAKEKLCTMCRWEGTSNCDECEHPIDDMPSIDAVKHGRWITVDYEEPRRYGCSECKRLVWHLENFCPSCGAKMDGEKNE